MRVQIIIPSSRTKPTHYPPYGALYIGTMVRSLGHEVDLLNLDLLRLSNEEAMKKIEEFKPDVIGFSAIVSTSYLVVKELSHLIRAKYPNMFIVLGGQLSRAAKVVLDNTPIDVVTVGESERTIERLFQALEEGKGYESVRGLAYRKNGGVVITEAVDQARDLDALPRPDFSLIDMSYYAVDPFVRWESFLHHIKKVDPRFTDPKRNGQKGFTIMTGRGCQAQCTFCCRNMTGIRKHSAEYIIDLMRYLKEKYNVGYFTFGDESFISGKRWVLDFVKKLQDSKLDILFYILGARVDTVDREILVELKKAGCFMIQYGFESGSQRILDLMEKRTTVAENIQAFNLNREVGLHTVPSNVLNMPGETPETVQETIEFLKSLRMDPPQYFVNYAQAHPGTPLYDYAISKGMITDEDAYLCNLTDMEAGDSLTAFNKGVLLNFSGFPLEEVLSWQERIDFELQMDWINRKRNGNKFHFLLFLPKYVFTRFGIRWKKCLKKCREEGIVSTMAYYGIRLRNAIKGMVRVYMKKGKQARAVANIAKVSSDLNDPALVRKINRRQFDSRAQSEHQVNKDVECYEEVYDGHVISRYTSLRNVILNLRKSKGGGCCDHEHEEAAHG